MSAPNGNKNHVTYGFSHTRIDNIYKSMITRCFCKNNLNYKTYGGRGITVCDEWRNDKTKFFEWALSHGYSDKLSIDRINVNGNYEPSNCRWATMKQQQNNKTNNRYIEWNGQNHTLGEWSEITGIKLATIHARLKNGWNIKKTLTTIPIIGNNQYR